MEIIVAELDSYLKKVSGRWNPNAAGSDVRALTDRLRFALQVLTQISSGGKMPAQVAREAIIKLHNWDEPDMKVISVSKTQTKETK